MTVAFIGTVLNFESGFLIVRELTTNEQYKIKPGNDQTLELEVGHTAVFIGQLVSNEFKLISYDIRKLIDPMYEEDLLNSSSNIVIDLVGDPFPEIFSNFLIQNNKYKEDYERYLLDQEELKNKKTLSKEPKNKKVSKVIKNITLDDQEPDETEVLAFKEEEVDNE